VNQLHTMEKNELLSVEDFKNYNTNNYHSYFNIDKKHVRYVRDDSDIVYHKMDRLGTMIREGECLYDIIYDNFGDGRLIHFYI